MPVLLKSELVDLIRQFEWLIQSSVLPNTISAKLLTQGSFLIYAPVSYLPSISINLLTV